LYRRNTCERAKLLGVCGLFKTLGSCQVPRRIEQECKRSNSKYDELRRQINKSAIRDYNTELLQRTLRDCGTVFGTLTPQEQSEALQCVLKRVTVHSKKLDLEFFELEEFHPGLQKRTDWLPRKYGFQPPLRSKMAAVEPSSIFRRLATGFEDLDQALLA
jgi:hypothetical protein